MSTDVILQRLLALHPNKLIDLKLDRIERLLDDLGRPQDRLPPTIHVAGTNGKGSTIAFMRAMLEAGGHRVHVYTSPHLVHFRERIRLAGTLVSARQLNAALRRCEQVNAGQPITYFEITTAAAILLFSEVEADYLLLEVGLGGRFDATNVIPKKLGTVITPVSLDHEDFLGSDLGNIALEKAGILQREVPAVIARQANEAEAAVEREAERLDIDLWRAGEHFDGYAQAGRFVFQHPDGLMDLPPPALIGPFQYDNASVAIAALMKFGVALDEAVIGEGVKNVNWPARMTPIQAGKLFDRLPQDSELWLDGGHNQAGGAVLAEALSQLDRRDPRPLTLVWGTFKNKDAAGYLSHFKALNPRVIAVTIPGERSSFAAGELAQIAAEMELEARTARSVQGGLTLAGKAAPHRVIVCGSLHLAGDFLAKNGTPPE